MLDSLTTFDIVICIGYLVVVIALGLWCAKSQHTNEDYFVGGRKMHWLPIGLSLFAGTFSANSFVGLPAEGAYSDWHLLLAIFFIPLVVSPILWVVFIPLYHRLRLTSAYEYLERRFNRKTRLMASLVYALYTIGWMGNMLVAVGVILRVVLNLDAQQTAYALIAVGLFATFYTTLGGVQAVVWTDALQAFALGGGMILVLLLGVNAIDGGWSTLWQAGAADGKFSMFNTDVNLIAGDANHLLRGNNFYGACAFGLFVYLAGHATSFTHVQRLVSMPSVAAARRSLIVNGIMVSVVCTLFFLVGAMLHVYYNQHDAGVLAELKANKKTDHLMPTFVLTAVEMPGLTGLLLAGLFAAVMSSIDSGINSLTALVVCDWLPGKEINIKSSRIICALFGFAAVAMSLILLVLGGDVFSVLMKIAGMFLGVLLGLFLLGIVVPRANSAGALIALAGGFLGMAAAFYWDVSKWWFGAYSCVPTFVVGTIASLAFPPPPQENLKGLVLGSSENPVEQTPAS